MKRSELKRRTELKRSSLIRLRRSFINKVGKKGKLNKQANRIMAKEFQGERYCEARLEGCWGNVALSWAHHSKRRKLSPEELTVAALVCIPCHDRIEILPPEEMKRVILGLIANRMPQAA